MNEKLKRVLQKICHPEHMPKKLRTSVSVPFPWEATLSNIKIEVHGLMDFTEEEREKFMNAMNIGVQVLNSVEFRDALYNATFTENRDMRGGEIWALICTGKDLYNQEADRDIDVFVTMYDNFWSGNIGYTFPRTLRSWFNRKFFAQFNEAEIFGNVMHEVMHHFGFDHVDFDTRLTTVPYQVGYAARDVAKLVLDGQALTPLRKANG